MSGPDLCNVDSSVPLPNMATALRTSCVTFCPKRVTLLHANMSIQAPSFTFPIDFIYPHLQHT